MKIKTALILCLALFLVSAGIGLSQRSSYTNITSDKEAVDQFAVSLLDESFTDAMLEGMPTMLEEDSPIIALVKGKGIVEYDFNINKELVEVSKIIKGDELHVGEDIYIIGSSRFFVSERLKNMGFVNHMVDGNSYLVFLQERMDRVKADKYPAYKLTETSLSPVFGIEPRENVIPSPDTLTHPPDSFSSVPYFHVRNNEFFADSEESMDNLLKLKEQILDGFQ